MDTTSVYVLFCRSECCAVDFLGAFSSKENAERSRQKYMELSLKQNYRYGAEEHDYDIQVTTIDSESL